MNIRFHRKDGRTYRITNIPYYGGTRHDGKLWISMITGESEDTVDAWIRGQYKIPKHHRKQIIDAIITQRSEKS